MPDFNQDRELGQGKKKWLVTPADKNIKEVIHTGKGDLKTDDLGRMLITDEVLAREIQKDHRRDLAVSRIFSNDPADRGHVYFFGQMKKPIPWHKYDENGFRIVEEVDGADDQEPPREDAEGLGELEPYEGEGLA